MMAEIENWKFLVLYTVNADRISLMSQQQTTTKLLLHNTACAVWDGCVGALTHQKWTGMSSWFRFIFFLFLSSRKDLQKIRDDVDWRQLHVADRLGLHTWCDAFSSPSHHHLEILHLTA